LLPVQDAEAETAPAPADTPPHDAEEPTGD